MSSSRSSSTLAYLPRYAWISAVLLLVLLAGFLVYQSLPSGGQSRDLSTPAARLVGHWMLYSSSDVPSAHLFFTATTALQDNKGLVHMVDVDGAMAHRGYYKQVHQYEHGQDMIILQDLGGTAERKVVLTVAHEGTNGRYRYTLLGTELDQRMVYLDARTEPPPGFAETLKAAYKGGR